MLGFYQRNQDFQDLLEWRKFLFYKQSFLHLVNLPQSAGSDERQLYS